MGVLETRNLDFRNLVMLSLNEGQLPKTGGEAAPRITAVVNILKRLILPGPVVYDALPKEVSGTIAPLDAFTKNRIKFLFIRKPQQGFDCCCRT